MYLYVSTPPISSSLRQFEFLLLEASVFLVRNLYEDEEDASNDTASNHHKHTCNEFRHNGIKRIQDDALLGFTTMKLYLDTLPACWLSLTLPGMCLFPDTWCRQLGSTYRPKPSMYPPG